MQPVDEHANGRTVLVTGATGYIGGRLVPTLLSGGYRVRVLVRDRRRVGARPWSSQVEIVIGDASDESALKVALEGVDSAFYLIHSMSRGTGFGELDLRIARSFGRAARACRVGHIIYLGGLGDSDSDLSPHLRSRQQTARALRVEGVPVTEFRASVIIGAGSISFEMIRNLVERLPIMICPRWIYSRVQPIAVGDVLRYLVAALDSVNCRGRTIEIGGGSVTNYRDLMLTYARTRGLRRSLLPVPVLTPRLSSYWIHWVTPVHASIARPLVEGLRNDSIVKENCARALFPEIAPMDHTAAIEGVIGDLERGRVETAWTDAAPTDRSDDPVVDLNSQSGLILERRTRRVDAPAAMVFAVVAGIGGDRGWYCANWAWRLRGAIDRLLGGVGLRRGRREPDRLRVGDALDFWRVEELEPGRRIRLRAEMKLPGRAWLEFGVRDPESGRTQLQQLAAFAPKGLPGLLYWYGLYPVHGWIFGGLIGEIARRAERGEPTRPAHNRCNARSPEQ